MAPRITSAERELLRWAGAHARPLTGTPSDFDELLDRIGDAEIVMLGEASHGTHEFYDWRARLTKRLLMERGFEFVAIEGDWPDAVHADAFARGAPGSPDSALRGFERFPAWMWRNVVVREFLAWLRAHNDAASGRGPKVGFYGLDVYSLHASMEAVIGYLQRVDPAAAAEVSRRYACFEDFAEDTQRYASLVHFANVSCEEDVVAALRALRRDRARLAAESGEDAFFQAELNALAAVNAERYYRLMIYGGAETWNLRDTHMTDVLGRIRAHRGGKAKGVVWAHNTHIGDFRATAERFGGYLNLGQLLREQHGEAVFALGFGTWSGTVTAAPAWDAPPRYMKVPPGREGSYEAIFHEVGLPRFWLPLKGEGDAGGSRQELRGERAIGVVYDPARERLGNYVPSRLAERYDAYCFFDTTLAIEPLDEGPEPPGLEAYPTGL